MTTTVAYAQAKLKFVKVPGDYPGLARYEADVAASFYTGKFVIEAVPSTAYEGRLDGYTVRWVPNAEVWRGRQIGSRTLRWGRGEKRLADAKKAAQADLESWGLDWA